MYSIKEKDKDKYYLVDIEGKEFYINNQLLFDIFKKIFKDNINEEKFLENFENFYIDNLSDFMFIDDILLKKIYNILCKYFLKEKLKSSFLTKKENGEFYTIPLYKEKEFLETQLIKILNDNLIIIDD